MIADDHGELVHDVRGALAMSRGELADALGMSKKSIAEFETGHQPVRRVVFLALESLLRRAGKDAAADGFRRKWERHA